MSNKELLCVYVRFACLCGPLRAFVLRCVPIRTFDIRDGDGSGEILSEPLFDFW